MQFTIHGLIEGQSVQITWSKGYIEGERGAVQELIALAEVLEGQPVGPEPDGPFTRRNHLADPLSAQVLIEDVMDEVTYVEGDLPYSGDFPNQAAA